MINKIKDSKFFERRKDLVHLITKRLTKGLILEFGVYKATLTNFMAKRVGRRTIYGFDTFTGLPEDWGTAKRGTFNLDGVLPEVEKNVQLIKGNIKDTLPKFFSVIAAPVALAYIDTDLYSSAKVIMEQLLINKRIIKGTIIVFDEMFGHEGYEEHEYAVWQEYEKRFKYKYIGWAEKGTVGIQIL